MTTSPPTTAGPVTDANEFAGFAHLFIVYVAWGSTFLAIRYAVQGPGAFSPFVLAALRVGIAGAALLLFAGLRGERLRLEPRLLGRLFVTGTLLWVGGHARLIWAAQWTDSGFGAILFASIPLWSAGFDARRDPRLRSFGVLLPVLSGFCGIVVLSLGAGSTPAGAALTTVILASAFSWALGAELRTPAMDRLAVSVSAGYQQLFAGSICAAIALARGETVGVEVDSRAIWCLFYLITVGSILAFSSYVRAQQLLPGNIVASFAYVNPVIAVALGFWFAHEQVSPMMIGGALLVLISVVWLIRATRKDGQYAANK